MGFTLSYRSTRPVTQAEAEAIERDGLDACRGRTWLSCEPVNFLGIMEDGCLLGASKPNFQPAPDDQAAAAQEGLPDGTTRDLINVLCQLSRDYNVDWEFSHDAHPGPIGYVRSGVCDDDVLAHADTFADLEDIMSEFMEGLTDEDVA
jgi:hypothetical protein